MNKQRNAEFKEKINVKQEKKGTKKEEGGTKGGTSMSLNDKEPTAEVGRVKITMTLGSGSKRREHLRIINSCRTAQELNERTALLRIWRVEIKHDQGEDKVVGDGYCGYAAMTNIIRGVERKLDMRERQDRLEVGMTIREMMSKSGGSVRKGWKKLMHRDLNHKERAQGAYEELMKEEGHFLAHKGLGAEYWMWDRIIDGRCDELKYSRWDKSTRMAGGYEMLESRFGSHRNKGQTLAHGEWRQLFREKMLMFSNKHYYVRDKDLSENLEEAMEVLRELWWARLGIGRGGGDSIVEEVHLIDLTPTGPCDALLVAEAVISKEEPPRLLDLGEADTRSRLRKVEYGLETFEATSLELNIDMGKGSIMGSSIGGERMVEICKENDTGFIRIKNGVMQRLVQKTNRPDVIHDEDTDHFYLNGVGKKENKGMEIRNNIIFWNCNSWRGDGTIDKATLLGAIARDEEADMMCITDVRLDNLDGLKGKSTICRTLGRITGKTWAGEYMARREDKRTGGAYIFHTVDWTNVKMNERIKYGVMTEINGNWHGRKYRVISVYRPCYGQSEGSLRITLDLELKAKFEEEFWNKLVNISNETCIIGGDFNMGRDQIDKKIIKEGMQVERRNMPGNPDTFHRWDNVKLNMQSSAIDHILITNSEGGGAKVSDTGLDLK